jgi:hypothetical protein
MYSMADLENWQNLLETQRRESQAPAFTPAPDGGLARGAGIVSIPSDPVLKPASDVLCIFGQIPCITIFSGIAPIQPRQPTQQS